MPQYLSCKPVGGFYRRDLSSKNDQAKTSDPSRRPSFRKGSCSRDSSLPLSLTLGFDLLVHVLDGIRMEGLHGFEQLPQDLGA